MTWFSLPPTRAESKAAFCDATSAANWLAKQPQANAPFMLSELLEQLQLLNVTSLAPRERFKTLEVFRKLGFAVSRDCQRRYENKPLPLSAAEQAQFNTVRRFWRAYAVAYLHGLRACLDGEASIAHHGAKVVHRVLSCLRMEQMNSYFAGAELDGDFWRILHSVLASAEQLGVVECVIEDRLLGETKESSVGGQYCMVLLLHLAYSFALSRNQLFAVTRWLARWRELAKVLSVPDPNPKSCCIALDLSQDRPVHDNLRVAGIGRWLSVHAVLRKIRQRLELLSEGESPESLKLGSGLEVGACEELLNTLYERLKSPQLTVADVSSGGASVVVAVGAGNSFRLLGGKGLSESVTPGSSFDNRLTQERIAVFGHAARDSEERSGVEVETWRIVKQEPGEWHLLRLAESGGARLMLGSLLTLQLPQTANPVLATISRLFSRADGSLRITVSLMPGDPLLLIADVREKPSGKLSRHPAFMLPAVNGVASSSVVIPSGVSLRALSIRFLDAKEATLLGLALGAIMERGNDYERWSFTNVA